MKTPLTKEEVMVQVRYDSYTGRFTYLKDRWVSRRYHFERAVEPKPRQVQAAGDKADKVYGDTFVGVYLQVGEHEGKLMGKEIMKPTMAVVSAAALAILLTDGYWPDAVLFEDGDWKNIKRTNLNPITKQEQGQLAGLAANTHERTLPRNVYGTSSGKFIGRRGRSKTLQYGTAEEALHAVEAEEWV